MPGAIMRRPRFVAHVWHVRPMHADYSANITITTGARSFSSQRNMLHPEPLLKLRPHFWHNKQTSLQLQECNKEILGQQMGLGHQMGQQQTIKVAPAEVRVKCIPSTAKVHPIHSHCSQPMLASSTVKSQLDASTTRPTCTSKCISYTTWRQVRTLINLRLNQRAQPLRPLGHVS